MITKSDLIQKICEISDEKYGYLANFAYEELQDYLESLEEKLAMEHEGKPVVCSQEGVK